MNKHQNKHEASEKRLSAYLKISLLGVLAAWSLTLAIDYFLLFGSKEFNAGLLGDSFGMVNALFSGCAFALLIYTSFMQREELKLQREELKDNRSEFVINRITNVVYKQLDRLDESVKEIKFEVKDHPSSLRELENQLSSPTFSELHGIAALSRIIRLFDSLHVENFNSKNLQARKNKLQNMLLSSFKRDGLNQILSFLSVLRSSIIVIERMISSYPLSFLSTNQRTELIHLFHNNIDQNIPVLIKSLGHLSEFYSMLEESGEAVAMYHHEIVEISIMIDQITLFMDNPLVVLSAASDETQS